MQEIANAVRRLQLKAETEFDVQVPRLFLLSGHQRLQVAFARVRPLFREVTHVRNDLVFVAPSLIF